MSNYPDGANTAGAPWNQPDAQTPASRCTICDRLCVSDDDGCTWRVEGTSQFVDAVRTPNGEFVCSKACNSQALYQAATEDEQAALRLLAKWNESTPILQKAFLSFNPYQKQMDIKYASVWERWSNAYDILKLYKMVEKIGCELTGDEEAPAWYTDAVNPAPERKPVQSAPLGAAGANRRTAGAK
jgi:hypothetical protein